MKRIPSRINTSILCLMTLKCSAFLIAHLWSEKKMCSMCHCMCVCVCVCIYTWIRDGYKRWIMAGFDFIFCASSAHMGVILCVQAFKQMSLVTVNTITAELFL